ncbi:hypothetical protein LA080_013054 [Diaporthe eres]|uniref:Uncharacterized protein n=1 Tax=Diaporthe vaccinii TaxID=105482 RepID=A0ABR4E8H9_9PEZI|nr:hypothetical protein LA080_013054 [Diaporthe eres]
MANTQLSAAEQKAKLAAHATKQNGMPAAQKEQKQASRWETPSGPVILLKPGEQAACVVMGYLGLYKDLDDLRKSLPESLKNASIRLVDSPNERDPRTFAQKIMKEAKFPGIVLTSSHPEVRGELVLAKVKFFFAHPHKHLEAQVKTKQERLSESQEKEEIKEHNVLLGRVEEYYTEPAKNGKPAQKGKDSIQYKLVDTNSRGQWREVAKTWVGLNKPLARPMYVNVGKYKAEAFGKAIEKAILGAKA